MSNADDPYLLVSCDLLLLPVIIILLCVRRERDKPDPDFRDIHTDGENLTFARI